MNMDTPHNMIRTTPTGTPARVLRYTAAISGISRAALTGPDHARRVAWPRMVAMAAMRIHSNASTTVIGRIMGGRDHSTVIHAIRRSKALRNQYSAFAAITQIINAMMRGDRPVYISGPITGCDNDNRETFDTAVRTINAAPGYIAINPHDIAGVAEWEPHFTDLPDAMKYQRYMRLDLSALSICTAIVMLDGWQQSPGARIEHRAATLGLITIYTSVSDFIDAQSRGDEDMTFISVRCIVQEVREKSALLDFSMSAATHPVWVPLMTLQPDDATGLRDAFTGEVRTIRIEKWKADEIGLTPMRNNNTATADLFAPTPTANPATSNA